MMAPLLILICVIALLSPWIPASVYWRDAGEFIISAFFLDVAHPPGSPVYAQVGNLFALLPIGPIAFRVNAFSAFCLSGTVALSWYIAFKSVRKFVGLSTPLAITVSSIPAVVLLLSPAAIRQGLTAEVYSFNALFVLGILFTAFQFRETKDYRYLVLAGFVAGLGMGNHASFIVPAGFAALAIVVLARPPLEVVCLAVTAAIIGLLSYGYIPARAITHPPLNSGYAVSLTRLKNHITDARDRSLRNEVVPVIGSTVGEGEESSGKIFNVARGMLRDASLAGHEIGWIVVAFGIFGAVALVFMDPLLGVVLLSLGAGVWLFFAGWDPDPWLPVFALAGIATSLTVAILSASVTRRDCWWGTIVGTAAVAAVFVGSFVNLPIGYFASLRDLTLPVSNPGTLLKLTDEHGVILTEYSWFPLSYLHQIEGVRPDITLVFQPNLIYPDLFTPVTLEKSGGEHTLLSDFASVPISNFDERIKNLGKFISFAAPLATIVVEPSPTTLSPIRRVVMPSSDGLLRIQYLKNGGEPSTIRKPIQDTLHNFREAIDSLPAPLRSDARNYAETLALAHAGYLEVFELYTDAALLLKELCQPVPKYPCSTTTLNNLGVYLMRDGKPVEAKELFLELLATRRDKNSVLKQNLKLALGAPANR